MGHFLSVSRHDTASLQNDIYCDQGYRLKKKNIKMLIILIDTQFANKNSQLYVNFYYVISADIKFLQSVCLPVIYSTNRKNYV